MKIVCQRCLRTLHDQPGPGTPDPDALADCPHCGAQVDVGAQITKQASGSTVDHLDHETQLVAPGLCRKIVGDYEVIDEIARGAMGVVYKARHTTLGRVVALKVLLAGEHASPQQVTRFEREARAAAKLRHPNIVPIYEIGQHEGRRYFTMDFIEGRPLDMLIAHKRITVPRALETAAAVADALAYAHGRGVIHRDIKPSNIMIDRQGRPQIMDFGLAKQLDSDTKFTRTGTTIGTPSYMSPEQARGENDRIDVRSDVYSLGAVLYEMLTGQAPFVGETMMNIVMKVIHDEPVPPRRLNPKLHRDIQTIVLKAMEKDPDRRYQTMGELANDIRRYLTGEMISARPAGPLRRVTKTVRRFRTTIVVGASIAAVATLVSGAIILALMEQQREADRVAEQAKRQLRLTQADQTPQWVIKFRDEFAGPKISPDWRPDERKAWSIQDGRLVVKADRTRRILLDKPPPEADRPRGNWVFEGNVRIRFDATAETKDARINCFLGGNPRTAYTFRFGAWDGHNLSLVRLGRPLAQIVCPPVAPGETYAFEVVRHNTTLTARITGGGQTCELEYDAPALLQQLARVKLGLATWQATVAFDDVRIEREEYPGPRLNVLQFVDHVMLSRGRLLEALGEYESLVTKYSGRSFGTLAHLRAGLILEASAGERQAQLERALQWYRDFETRAAGLPERHGAATRQSRERTFFTLAKLGRFDEAARLLERNGGPLFAPGTAWHLPGILSRCVGAREYGSALAILRRARFAGPRATLADQWRASGGRTRSHFARSVTNLCSGFAEQKQSDQMKLAFDALPAPEAARSFETAVERAVAANDVPISLDLLAFCHARNLRTTELARSAQNLAGRFIDLKQYSRVVNVHTAYPSRRLVRHFVTATLAWLKAGGRTGATELLEQAARRFPEDRRLLRDATSAILGACLKAKDYACLRRVYDAVDDHRFASRLVDAVRQQLEAGELTGAARSLDHLARSVKPEPPELPVLADSLAAAQAQAGRPELVLEYAAQFPSPHMAAAFQAAIEVAVAARSADQIERFAVPALSRFPAEAGVRKAARQAASVLIDADEPDRALRFYEGAAGLLGQDAAKAAALRNEAARLLLAAGAWPQAAAAYEAVVRTLPEKSAVAAPALLRLGTVLAVDRQPREPAAIWREIIEKHASSPEAQVAGYLTGQLTGDDFEAWAKKHDKEIPAPDAAFYRGLKGALDRRPKPARTQLESAIRAARNAWFVPAATAFLERLPALVPEPEPPEEPR
jgi:predicted Ser/Thr protein kinase/tetratricopeptide (TPR) repeat protein